MVVSLDILGIKFATTREQSLCELCLAVVAGGWQPGFHQAVAFLHLWDCIVWKSAFSGVCEEQPGQAVSSAGQELTCSVMASVCSSPSTMEGLASLPARSSPPPLPSQKLVEKCPLIVQERFENNVAKVLSKKFSIKIGGEKKKEKKIRFCVM